MPDPTFAVLTDRTDVETEHGWTVAYRWDHAILPTEREAVTHGRDITESGDFTIAVIFDGRIAHLATSEGHEILQTTSELRRIAEQTGIESWDPERDRLTQLLDRNRLVIHLPDDGPASRKDMIEYVTNVLTQRTTVDSDTTADRLAASIVTSILSRLGIRR